MTALPLDSMTQVAFHSSDKSDTAEEHTAIPMSVLVGLDRLGPSSTKKLLCNVPADLETIGTIASESCNTTPVQRATADQCRGLPASIRQVGQKGVRLAASLPAPQPSACIFLNSATTWRSRLVFPYLDNQCLLLCWITG